MKHHRPGNRLVTQNFLASAGSFERQSSVNWESIRQLSVLIDLVCLCDQINVVGRQAYELVSSIKSPMKDVYRPLLNVVDIYEDGLVQSASSHMMAFLGESVSSEQNQILVQEILTPKSIERSYRSAPDEVDDFKYGEMWVRTLPPAADPVVALDKENDMHRSVTFFVRTFLYLAYSEANEIPFTLDEARASILPQFIDKEINLRRSILEKLKEVHDQSVLVGNIDVKRSLTPLASVVYSRAMTRNKIPEEVARLREELTSLRARLTEAEDALFYATHDKQASAFRKWTEVLDELERRYGKGEGYVACRGLLGFAEKAVEVALDPTKWNKLISLPIEILRRATARRPIVEIYELLPTMPGLKASQRDIDRLFGNVASPLLRS